MMLFVLVATVLIVLASGDPTTLPTADPTTRCESSCPTSCPDGYGYTDSYRQQGCVVFCTEQPSNGQCEVGGSGCTSSCAPCAELSAGSPCPTSCPNGFVTGTDWYQNGCPVYCMEQPANGQCQVGGSGCTSSCLAVDTSSSSPTHLPTTTPTSIPTTNPSIALSTAPTLPPTTLPSANPTSVHTYSPTFLPTANPTTRCESSCPTSCPDGYGYTDSYRQQGCVVFCTEQPSNGQCEVGGSGCTSSCAPCAELSAGSPCPTSCPNGFVTGTDWYQNGCPVYCMEQPANGQCQVGGSGCTSSCIAATSSSSSSSASLSTGAVAGVAVAAVVVFVAAVLVAMWFFSVGLFAAKVPMAAQESELAGRV